jgi:hypothetical protein
MSSLSIPPLPVDTAYAAEFAFGRDHPYLRIGRQLDELLTDFILPEQVRDNTFLADIFWPYSLASILQFWEYLTDHQMVDATRTRLDLKYALHLPLNFPGFKQLALCIFRKHALVNGAIKEGFQELIDQLKDFVGATGKSQTAEHMLDTLCLLSRAEMITGTMGKALEAVAVHYPNWLLSNALPHWYRLYYKKHEPQRLPRDSEKIEDLLQAVGRDGLYLLETISKTSLLDCRNLPEVKGLRREWECQFEFKDGSPKLRSANCYLCYDGIE